MFKFPGSLSWINPEEDSIIAATGAGGKTSCLEYLALQLKQLGHRVLLTTTTRIFRPSPTGFGQYIDRLIDSNVLEQAGIEPRASSITLAGFPDENPEKLKGLSPADIQQLIELDIYDNILIEADGSRQRPLKAPRADEPVLPDNCQIIIGVTGWNGISNPVSPQNIHRWEQFVNITGLSEGERPTPRTLFPLLNDKHGLFKNAPASARKVWLINQVDQLSDRTCAREFIASVQSLSPPLHHCVISSFRSQSAPFVEGITWKTESSENNHLI